MKQNNQAHYTLPPEYKKSFKPADIRGVYPHEIDGNVAYHATRAFVANHRYEKLVVGHDMRESSPELYEGVVEGARDAGALVIDLGMVATPQLYFASGSMQLPGVMITASHSPREYNGMKFVHADAVPLTQSNGMKELMKVVTKGQYLEPKKRGRIIKKDISKAYQKFVLKGMKPSSYAGLIIATDIGNGMASAIVPLLQEKLPIKFATIFAKPDGRFPNRDSDPNLRDNQIALDNKIDRGHYDFGISFDGDSDRIAFLDEQGNYVNSAAIGALIAKRLLGKEPKAKIASTNLNSRIYEETIRAHGGKVVMAKTGHTFVKEQMRKHDAVFGCEYSGHFFFRDFFYTDSVVLTLRHVLDEYLEAKAAGKAFSEMMAPFLVYQQTEDVVVKVADKDLTMKKILIYLKAHKPLLLKEFDGYYVDFGDVWGAVKVSVTEYAIKLMFESTSKTKAQKAQRELVKFVKSIAKEV
jgi:phosphomannomutase